MMRALFLAFALVACSAATQGAAPAALSPASLNGTSWSLIGASTEPTPGVSFSQTSVSGPAGCNRWFSS
jgi:heat shock protein HslJ